MTDDTAIAAVLLLVAAFVVAPVAAAAPTGGPVVSYGAQDTESPDRSTDGNATVQPGERLSGVVSVQQAEIEGEVDERTFGVKVARANSNTSKAAVVAEQLASVDRRIAELEERKQHLKEALANGTIGEGEYRAKMAAVAVEIRTTMRLANASERTARGLPATVLAEKGIEVSAIRTLQDRAGNLSGPVVAAIAQSIAGKDVGRSMAGVQMPAAAGERPPGQARNGSDVGPGGAAGPGKGDDTGGVPGGDAGAPNGTDGALDGTDGTLNGTDDALNVSADGG